MGKKNRKEWLMNESNDQFPDVFNPSEVGAYNAKQSPKHITFKMRVKRWWYGSVASEWEEGNIETMVVIQHHWTAKVIRGTIKHWQPVVAIVGLVVTIAGVTAAIIFGMIAL